MPQEISSTPNFFVCTSSSSAHDCETKEYIAKHSTLKLTKNVNINHCKNAERQTGDC